MKPYLIGIDAGNTSSKVVIFDTEGNIMALSSSKSSDRMKLKPRQKGFEEFDVDEFWNMVSGCIRMAIHDSGIDAADVAGIGITSFGNGVVFLDKNGWSIAPGCFSQDYRANDIIELYKREGTYEKINAIVHGTLFAGKPGPILRWYKEHERSVYDRIGSVLMFKDYLMYRLSGNFATNLNVFGGGIYG
jgi:L-xylulokinase